MIGLVLLAFGAPQVVDCASQADAQIRALVASVEHKQEIRTVVGPSMGAAMPAGSIVLIAAEPFSEIARAAIPVANFKGIPTAHRATARCVGGWWVKGDASQQLQQVTPANYLGCVTMVFRFPAP